METYISMDLCGVTHPDYGVITRVMAFTLKLLYMNVNIEIAYLYSHLAGLWNNSHRFLKSIITECTSNIYIYNYVTEPLLEYLVSLL